MKLWIVSGVLSICLLLGFWFSWSGRYRLPLQASIDDRAMGLAVDDAEEQLFVTLGNRQLAIVNLTTAHTTDYMQIPDMPWCPVIVVSKDILSIPARRGFTLQSISTGKIIAAIEDPQLDLRAQSLSHNRQSLATSWYDGTLRVYSLEPFRHQVTLKSGGYIPSMFFSPDDTILYGVSSTGLMQLWNLQNAESPIAEETYPPKVTGSVLSKCGNYVATMGESGALRPIGWIMVQDRRTKQPYKCTTPGQGTFTNVEFDPSSRWIIGSCSDGYIYSWQLGMNARPRALWIAHDSEIRFSILPRKEQLAICAKMSDSTSGVYLVPLSKLCDPKLLVE
jgi:WD40 repeat protein